MRERTICKAHIASLLRILSFRDAETEEHTERVTSITVSFAGLWDLPGQQLKQLRYGAQLHDIGKVAIPDAILHKRGSLTDEERAVMRMHPVYAHDILYPIPYLRRLMDIPYCHHEKWDGSGYPRGLKGSQIPFAARLFAIVDVWDALLSDRPYHPAWNRCDALAYLRAQSGRHFDPEIVRRFGTFLGTVPEFKGMNPLLSREPLHSLRLGGALESFGGSDD